jgi:hypothetical protein
MVGGYIIDVTVDHIGMRLWCVDSQTLDETAIYVEPPKVSPLLRDYVWWQGKQAFWSRDGKEIATLTRIGNSFKP